MKSVLGRQISIGMPEALQVALSILRRFIDIFLLLRVVNRLLNLIRNGEYNLWAVDRIDPRKEIIGLYAGEFLLSAIILMCLSVVGILENQILNLQLILCQTGL